MAASLLTNISKMCKHVIQSPLTAPTTQAYIQAAQLAKEGGHLKQKETQHCVHTVLMVFLCLLRLYVFFTSTLNFPLIVNLIATPTTTKLSMCPVGIETVMMPTTLYFPLPLIIS